LDNITKEISNKNKNLFILTEKEEWMAEKILNSYPNLELIKHKGKFVSLKKEDDPSVITEQRAIELVEEKREKERNKYIKTFDDEDIQVLNGCWGPYIAHKKKNYKIPKETEAKDLSLEDCKKIIKESGTKKKTTRKKKSK
jgi:DNA topoisomerase-1